MVKYNVYNVMQSYIFLLSKWMVVALLNGNSIAYINVVALCSANY